MRDDERVATLTRLVMRADRCADETERELAAAMKDLDASHARVAALGAELTRAHARIAELEQVIAAGQHAAVCAHHAYLMLQAERDALLGRLVGGIAPWTPVAWERRN